MIAIAAVMMLRRRAGVRQRTGDRHAADGLLVRFPKPKLAARRDRRIAVVRSRRLGHIVPDADLYQLDARAGMLPRRQRSFDRILDHVGFLAFQPRDEFRLSALRPHKRGHQTGDP